MIAPGESTQITFTPRPFGLHWYHTHTAAHRDLKRGVYSGQFGVLLVEPRSNPAPYDQEQFLVLHDWVPYFVASGDGSEMVNYVAASINGRMLGHDDPIQVKEGQRILFHILNASATEAHWLALAGHQFQVIALDGRPVPTQAKVDQLRLGPAERISAIVTMNTPGVWILGERAIQLSRRWHGHRHRICESNRKAATTTGNKTAMGLSLVWRSISCQPSARCQFAARVYLALRRTRRAGSLDDQRKIVS